MFMKKLFSSQILYISIDGIMEPLGLSQVFKYLEKLSHNHQINLITFEKKQDLKNKKKYDLMKKECSRNNIAWYARQHRSGLGQIINILNVVFLPIYILCIKKISLIHLRSYMPGICIPVISILFRFKLIFDIRGFWANEKHDRLNWSKYSYKFRFFKWLEKYLFNKADAVITLTNASKDIIANHFKKLDSSIHVIPTCVDCDEFSNSKIFQSTDTIKIGYLGSTDTAYDFKTFCNLVNQISNQNGRNIELKVFTKDSKEIIKNILIEKKINISNLEVKFVERKDLPMELSQLSFLGFYLKENFSVQASMPTKIAEALACGIPIICNEFNGDIKKLIEKNSIGLIYNFSEDFDQNYYNKLSEMLSDKNLSNRCISVARNYFSLEEGSLKYNKIYKNLLNK
jgi:glycosyltransferase involved in cell wall biosynthesis